MKMKHHFPLTTLAAAILTVHAQGVQAAEGDDIQQYTKPDSSISVGVGHWSDDRMQQGMYDGMWEDGTYGSIDASVLMRNDSTGTWTRFTTRNLGLDTVELGASYEKQGDWGVGVEYSQTPRQNPVVVNTALQGIGTERQTVTPVTNPATTRDNARDVFMEVQRDATSLNMFKRFSPNLEIRVNFKNEEKEGDRQYGVRVYPTLGSTSGSYPAFVAEPIDSTTRQLDALFNYTSEKLQLTGGYYGSWYNNHNDRLDVIGTANGVTEMSLPPDNEAHQGYIQGNYAFTPTTHGMFKAAYTHATQNDPFISTMNNNVAAWAPLASVGSSLKGEINTTELMAGITSNPMKNLSLVAKVNYRDVDDETPVRVDANGGEGPYHNNPFSSTKTTAMAEGTYRLEGGYSITAGLDYSHQKREISSLIEYDHEIYAPYRDDLNEWTYRLGARRSLSETLNGSIVYSHSKRDGSSYSDAEGPFAEATPIHIADRNRDKVKFAMDWNPIQPLGFQFSFAHAQDEYPNDSDHRAGVRKGTAQLWAVDASYALNDNWQLSAWYSYDITEVEQTGYLETDPDNVPSYADLSDKAHSLGLGVKGKVTSKFDVGMNFDWVRSNADYTQTQTAKNSSGSSGVQASTVPLPDVENKITRLSLYGNYVVNKHSSIRADVIWEHWKTDDWTWTFSNGSPYYYATEGTMVINDPNQQSTFVGLRYTYKF